MGLSTETLADDARWAFPQKHLLGGLLARWAFPQKHLLGGLLARWAFPQKHWLMMLGGLAFETLMGVQSIETPIDCSIINNSYSRYFATVFYDY